MLKRRRRGKDVEEAIKATNSKPDDDFIREYLVRHLEGHPSPWTTTWKHPTTDETYSLSLTQSNQTSDDDLEACFLLIKETSAADYAASSRGWNPKQKRSEMREPDLRYLIVRDQTGTVRGFTSLMPTMEEGQPVVYCYEIHLQPELRGTGMAGLLMSLLETIARNIEVMEKVMLTVFTCNARAMAFYRRCGFEADDMSPRARRLRGGVVKEPDYVIMSKRVARSQAAQGGADEKSSSVKVDEGGNIGRPSKVAKLHSGTAHEAEEVPEQ